MKSAFAGTARAITLPGVSLAHSASASGTRGQTPKRRRPIMRKALAFRSPNWERGNHDELFSFLLDFLHSGRAFVDMGRVWNWLNDKDCCNVSAII
jgi:hypothetical protein